MTQPGHPPARPRRSGGPGAPRRAGRLARALLVHACLSLLATGAALAQRYDNDTAQCVAYESAKDAYEAGDFAGAAAAGADVSDTPLGAYATAAQRLLDDGLLNEARTFDDSKVSDHFAIIPTGTMPPRDLSGDDKRLFDLVARRFFATFILSTSSSSFEGKSSFNSFINVSMTILLSVVCLLANSRTYSRSRSDRFAGSSEVN